MRFLYIIGRLLADWIIFSPTKPGRETENLKSATASVPNSSASDKKVKKRAPPPGTKTISITPDRSNAQYTVSLSRLHFYHRLNWLSRTFRYFEKQFSLVKFSPPNVNSQSEFREKYHLEYQTFGLKIISWAYNLIVCKFRLKKLQI